MEKEKKVYEIREEHLADIEQGKHDIENGDFITVEEFE
jgi:predicted transcriptional regulator